MRNGPREREPMDEADNGDVETPNDGDRLPWRDVSFKELSSDWNDQCDNTLSGYIMH